VRNIFLLWVLLGFVYEAVALYTPQRGDTISEIVWDFSARYPLLVLGFGLLMGHFFWQRHLS
jgi:hypothetical protein